MFCGRTIVVYNSGGDIISTLYIIGNGFDVAHGLNTSYWKFREFLENEAPYFLNAFEALYNIHPLDDTEPWYTEAAQERWNKAVNHDLWSEFERAMGKPNTTEMIEQAEAVTEGMPSVNIRDHMDVYWKEQFGFISKLQDYVREWIESIDTRDVGCKKKSLVGSDDYFLNFNYTDVLEKIYRIENVLHIHGGVSSACDIPPVMGHCNKQDIVQHRKWAKEADEEYSEAEASVLDAVADYLETIYKDTKEHILLNHPFFDKLSNVKRIIVFGWSGGDVDIPYLKEIIRNVNNDAKWTVYWYDEKDYKTLCAVFEKEGITDSGIIEYIQSNNFWVE